jgi:hypothetical protein
MVSNSSTHPGRTPLRPRPRLVPRRGPLRSGLIAYWLLAGVLVPAASVVAVLWLIGPLGYAGALVVTALAAAALLAAAASRAERTGARVRAVGGLVLSVVVTWGALALAFVVAVSSCHGCLK